MANPDSGVKPPGSVSPSAPPQEAPLCPDEKERVFSDWFDRDRNLREALRCARELRSRGFVYEISIVPRLFADAVKLIPKGRATSVQCAAKPFGANSKQEESDINEALEGINREIEGINSLIATCEDRRIIGHLNRLQQIREEFFLYHKAQICSARTPFDQWAKAEAYGEASPHILDELAAIRQRIEPAR